MVRRSPRRAADTISARTAARPSNLASRRARSATSVNTWRARSARKARRTRRSPSTSSIPASCEIDLGAGLHVDYHRGRRPNRNVSDTFFMENTCLWVISRILKGTLVDLCSPKRVYLSRSLARVLFLIAIAPPTLWPVCFREI